MSIKKIAGRYAKSLLDLAIEKNTLDATMEDMRTIQGMCKNRDLYLLLKSPIVNIDKKKSVFKALFDPYLNEISKAFVNLILVKRREELLPEIADEFIDQYKAYKGITSVIVTSAVPLDKDALQAISKKLLDSNITANELEIEQKVNPDLLGGFVIQVGDKLYDNSISHKLNKLSQKFVVN